MPTPLHRVIVFVSDVERCAKFYRDAFGFAVFPSDPPAAAKDWIELDTGGCRLAFHRARGAAGPTGSENHPHKICFFAQDVEAERDRLVKLGVEMKKVMRSGHLVLCDGRDVEGHAFQISNRA